MQSISMFDHDFQKTNLVTQKGGHDTYKCSICGCEGKRHSLDHYISVTEAMAAKAEKCSYKPVKAAVKRPKLVLTKRIPVEGGVSEGLHEVVECPAEYKSKYESDVWILAKSGVPVRVLPNEIIDSEY